MSIASEITRLQGAKSSLKTAINAKTDAQHQIANETIDDYATFVDSIQTGGGGVSTQSQSIFTGYTAPLTWLNSTNNVFEYKSETHNITITGLSNVAAITGNGTKTVTVTIDTTASSDRQTHFTISCTKDNKTLTYYGIEFHYGIDVTAGNCLAVAQTLINNQISYIFIESSSLPTFGSSITLWNSIYPYQLISFDFAKSNLTYIENQFLRYCYSFNQPLTLPNTVTSIGDYFLYQCYSFNQPLIIPNTLTSIGNYFLTYSYSFNQPLIIPNTLTSIGDYFLSYSYSFNQPLIIPNTLTSIGNTFLYQGYSFNQPLSIPSDVTTIGDYFLGNCSSFNQPLIISSNITSIGNYFLQYCYSFNQPLTIPSNVTTIGNSFLMYCYSFNQPLTIPSNVTTIGNSFLMYCYSFNQPLTIPSNVTTIGNSFLNNCYSFIYLEYNTSVYPTDNNSISQNTNTKTSTSGTGILITGTGANGLKNALPNRTVSPYRKLILAGA